MKQKLNKREFLMIALTLFAMFFGAGNFIFPPIVGKNAGENFYIGIMFFCVTAVLLPVFGVAAIAKAKGLKNLVNRVDPIFAIVFITLLYLTIGPLFAIPRAANMPFDIAIRNFIPQENVNLSLFLYSACYFALNYYLCVNPSKIVNMLGRYLTPALLILIAMLFIAGVIFPMGEFSQPQGAYVNHAVATGFVDGYQTMDALASLAFGIIVINAVKNSGIKNENHLVISTIQAGVVAGMILLVIYLALGYLGATSASLFPQVDKNGAMLLSYISEHLFGGAGVVVLGAAFALACLTTTIGLVTSASEYFEELTGGRIKYKFWSITWSVIGFAVANFGLETIISGSIPVLIAIYPISIILIILSLINPLIKSSKIVYRSCVYVSAFIGTVNGLDIAGLQIWFVTDLVKSFPLYDSMLGWVVPSLVAFVISYILYLFFDKKVSY
ncbi:MAG: branched-chain amino acid transport system II carrier protein [Campylobacter sp.]